MVSKKRVIFVRYVFCGIFAGITSNEKEPVTALIEYRWFIIGLNSYWNSLLDYSIGLLYWITLLEFSIGILYWNSLLEFSIGILFWNSLLEFSFSGVRITLLEFYSSSEKNSGSILDLHTAQY
jgi:hypothetical protein